MQKKSIVYGVTGQIGSYLAEKLLFENYKVYGLQRRTSGNSLENLKHLKNEKNFEIIEGDLTDLSSLIKLNKLIQPDEVYNLAAQSQVGTSFAEPISTFNVTATGVLNCLEATRQTNNGKTKFLQISTSEMFGGMSKGKPYNEMSSFHPRSPYGVAKLAAHWLAINYKESYNMDIRISLLFNTESSRRGPYFVTQKIAKAVAKIKKKEQDFLYLGNLNAYRDWSHAKDIVNGIYLTMQYDIPEYFVFSSDETHSIKEFCEKAFSFVELNYKDYVKIDAKFFRPAEVDILKGDSAKARKILNWKPKYSFDDLVKEMVFANL